MKIAFASILFVACTVAPPPQQPILRDAPPEYSSVPVYVAGGDIAPPKHINYVDPRVPAALKDRRNENRWKVTVGLVIDETGRVKEAWFVRGEELLAAPTIKAAHQWRFEPARRNGAPIAVRCEETLTMTIHRNTYH